MRRLVAALVMAALALTLTACGGDATAAPPPPAAAAPSAAAPKPASTGLVPTTVSKTNLLSPGEAGANAAFPVGSHTPKVVTDHIASRQPMLVYFYDPAQNTSDDQRAEIDSVLKEYRGLIDLVAFDVTGALPDPVTNKVSNDKLSEQVALLTQDLQVGFTPYVVLVDKRGVMTGRYRGFIDRALLEREVLKAVQ